jgi:arsenate reductase
MKLPESFDSIDLQSSTFKPSTSRHRKGRVLFVCYGNSCRSQIAEAFARHHGAAFLDAASAGFVPSSRVSSRVRKAMAERGIPLSAKATPRPLSACDLASFDLIVNLTEFGLPKTATPILKIPMQDVRAAGDDVLRELRDEIEQRVLSIAEKFRPKATFRPILLFRGIEAA